MRTGPGNRDAQVSGLWPEAAALPQLLDLRLDRTELQLVDLQVLRSGCSQEVLFLNPQSPELHLLDLLRLHGALWLQLQDLSSAGTGHGDQVQRETRSGSWRLVLLVHQTVGAIQLLDSWWSKHLPLNRGNPGEPGLDLQWEEPGICGCGQKQEVCRCPALPPQPRNSRPRRTTLVPSCCCCCWSWSRVLGEGGCSEGGACSGEGGYSEGAAAPGAAAARVHQGCSAAGGH